MKHAARRLSALTLVIVGLVACAQSAVREQSAAARPDYVVPQDTGLVAAPGPAPESTGTDTTRATAAADTGIPAAEPNTQNTIIGPLYASAAGPAGGGITHSESKRGGGWADNGSWTYGGQAAWQAPSLAAATDSEDSEAGAPLSPQCAEFARDVNADLGAVLKAGCEPTLAQMSALMDNPLGNVAMWINQYDFFRMENKANGKTGDKHNYMGILQFPKGLGEDWNLINRVVYNVPSMPLDQDKIDNRFSNFGTVPGGGGGAIPPSNPPGAPIDIFNGRTTGFGDMYYVGLVSPKKPIKLESGGSVLWGAGLDAGFPTATEDLLGTGKWLAGPSALGVYLGPKWKIGGLVQHYWDYAGDDDRDDVNLTNFQYFVYYSLDEVTSIGAGPNVIANWEQDSDNAFTVPIGIGLNRTFQFGKVPVRIGTEFHYSVIQPDDTVGTDWGVRFYVIPAVASALFDWMQ